MWRRLSAAPAPENEEAADLQHRGQLQVQTTATAGNTVKVTPGTPLTTSDPTQPTQSSSSSSSLSLSTVRYPKTPNYLKERRIPGSNRRTGSIKTDQSNPGLNVSGSMGRKHVSRAITRHVTLCFPTTAVISSSVIESRSSAGVDGSSLRMRRDPAQQPNRQTEKRATAVSCVGDHKHTLSRPTLSLCCWASVKTQLLVNIMYCMSPRVVRQLHGPRSHGTLPRSRSADVG